MRGLKDKTILVLGATGLQGGTVARHLLANGWKVRFLTRNPSSPNAARLRAMGAEPVGGNLNDLSSLGEAFAGVGGVYSVQDFWEHGYDREVGQGRNAIAAAKAAGVQHFVYISVGGADRTAGLGIRHFDSKAAIEETLVESGLSHTIIRPVSFFENFTSAEMFERIFRHGLISFPFPGDRPFQLVALEDEAKLVAKALSDPGAFNGRAVEIASDVCLLNDLATAIGEAAGVPVRFREVKMDVFAEFVARTEAAGLTGATKVGASLVEQLNWNRASETGGWAADMDAMDRLIPDRMSMREWVASVDWQAARAEYACEAA